ncbi:hypothetical protein HIM_04291 [Hirsutella minnesotensis 3608]|uniref:Major facilitator superfamily (MFS) profile domain-containing protein n=1 Tax=Hirsutella minnesotensis 3608 TaxID=1043627 RepID=A0A0F8A5Z9_9HYPO|nr:hypothetical protein HIM_04291 [Hirsutella minnesotensis 3608]
MGGWTTQTRRVPRRAISAAFNDMDQDQGDSRDMRTSSNSSASSGVSHDSKRQVDIIRVDIELQNQDVIDIDDNAGDEEVDAGSGLAAEQSPSTLDRVMGWVTPKSSYDTSPPPDGGLVAWLQCMSETDDFGHGRAFQTSLRGSLLSFLSVVPQSSWLAGQLAHTSSIIGLVGHLVTFNTTGWINSSGTFQAYYTGLLGRPPSDVAWIGSLNVFLLFFVGTLTGRLVDAGHFRLVFGVGTVLLGVGIFSVSACRTYWQLVATGGLVFAVMVRQLLLSIGFPWTVRVIGLVQLATMIVANVLARPRTKPRKRGPLVEWSAFRELNYTFYAVGSFFNFVGIYFAFFYTAAFSRDALRPPLSYSESLNLLLVLNGAGVIGRILPNYVADQVGALNISIPTFAISSVLVFCFMAIRSPTALYAWVVPYGIVAAADQSLFPAVISLLTTDVRKLGVRMGMVFTIISFASLTGPPIAGAIIASSGGYAGAEAFAGGSFAMGCGFLVAAKVATMRATGQRWADKI